VTAGIFMATRAIRSTEGETSRRDRYGLTLLGKFQTFPPLPPIGPHNVSTGRLIAVTDDFLGQNVNAIWPFSPSKWGTVAKLHHFTQQKSVSHTQLRHTEIAPLREDVQRAQPLRTDPQKRMTMRPPLAYSPDLIAGRWAAEQRL
jgi:hypothetical protein